MEPVEIQSQSQSISILPINGTQFTAGKKVIFEVTPDIGFMRASRGESYLSFTVRNSGSARWMFATSGQSLIQRVEISSMATGQQLESLQEYNKMMWLLNQYTESAHGVKQSTEGLRRHVTSLETFSNGVTAPRIITSDETAESVMNSIISPIKSDGTKVFQGWQVLVPLKAGIFSCFQEEKLTPVMALGGLRIELTLEDEALVCVPIQPIVNDKECLIVSDLTTAVVVTQGGAGTSQLQASATTISALGLRAGQIIHVQATGLAQQAVRITSIVQSGANVLIDVDTASDVSGGNGRIVGSVPVSNAGAGTTATIPNTTVEKCGLVVGQSVTLSDVGTTAATAKEITAIAQNGNNVDITFVGNLDLSGGKGCLVVTTAQWESARSYNIDSIEYRIQQIMPPKAIVDKTDKGINYSFRTWNLFFDSIPSGSKRHQVELPSVSSMAKAIWTHYSFASLEQDVNMPQYYTGATPDDMNLNSLQYFINNKLFPLRSYDPRVKRDRPQQYNEMQKAFASMGSPIKSFGDASGSNLDGYSNTYLSCRELARGNYVYSLREAEPSIRLAFTSTRDEIVRVNTFIWSDHVVRTDASGISVVL